MLIGMATEDDVSDLAVVLVDVVAGGACLGFLAGVTLDEAENFWRESLRGAHTWVARSTKADPVVGPSCNCTRPSCRTGNTGRRLPS